MQLAVIAYYVCIIYIYICIHYCDNNYLFSEVMHVKLQNIIDVYDFSTRRRSLSRGIQNVYRQMLIRNCENATHFK